MVFFGLFGVVLGCFGLFWVVLGCFGLFWVVLGCFGLFWVVLGCFFGFPAFGWCALCGVWIVCVCVCVVLCVVSLLWTMDAPLFVEGPPSLGLQACGKVV